MCVCTYGGCDICVCVGMEGVIYVCCVCRYGGCDICVLCV